MEATGRVEYDDRSDGIVVLRFVNPPDGYLDDASEFALEAALDRIETDDAVRVVILTGGQADVFVRHYDVHVLESRARAMAAREMRFSVDRPVPETRLLRCLRRIELSERIYLAAINGVAMGGGFELALACDLRIADEGSYPIGLPEVNIGLLPGAGGTQRLSRLIGQARALQMILLGRTAAPAEAQRLGMIHECVAAGALERAIALASRLANQPRRALAHVKRLVRQAHEGGEAGALETGLAHERTRFCDLMVRAETIGRMHEMNAGERDIRD